MEGATTDSLRALAPKWSLAGDDQLLNLLQSTHQRIIAKCQDVNTKLEEMASGLDEASIHLQNVNNKFMALSNSQFIESRVYDDDEHLTAEIVSEKPLPPPAECSAPPLRSALSALERAHDAAEIADGSDSDSDDNGISVVFRLRDRYPHRPLPHIIGTRPWKDKWHAGLIPEESDSEGSVRSGGAAVYSESCSEAEERTISSSRSSLSSEPAAEPRAPPALRPSDVAAELARRLGGDKQVSAEPEELPPPAPAAKHVYKPEKPTTSAIFSDEPPPLDNYVPVHDDDVQSEDEDIFAEINRNKPYTQQRNVVKNSLADDLFSFDKPPVEQGDIFSDFAPENVETKAAKQKSTLFEDESEPELFVEQPPGRNVPEDNISTQAATIKKPVGGISLFGTNKGAESIGAAILKRNQRKSSTSGDESSGDVNKPNVKEKPEKPLKNIEKTTLTSKDEIDKVAPKNEKDIFDDLFAKPEKEPKKGIQKIVQDKEKVNTKDKGKTSVKDLFSDNIFDDIDDIFTSDVKMPSKESNQKSIFDDDDLFSDIPKPILKNEPTSSKNSQKVENNKKSIFDSDDELFNDVKTEPQPKNENKPLNENYNQERINKVENTIKPTETLKERNLFDDSPQIIRKPDSKPQIQSKSLFDSDSDDDIFASVKKTDKPVKITSPNLESKSVDREITKADDNSKILKGLKAEEAKVFQSPSLFEEDEIDDLFINANKSNILKETKIAEVTMIDTVKKGAEIVKDTDNLSQIDNIVKFGSSNNDLPNNINEIEQNNVEETFVPTPSGKIFDEAIIFDNKEVIETPKQTPKEISKTKVIESSQTDSESAEVETTDNFDEQTVITKSVPDKSIIIESKNVEIVNIRKEKRVNETVRDNFIEPVNEKGTLPTNQETPVSNEPEEFGTNQSVFDDFIKPDKEKEPLNTLQKKSVSVAPNVFDDIFAEPPAFEKPVEPKKSKNVNALFDDDSDDELFFKKNDVISDEKPEIFTQNANFGIFVDEPPAIDVDFTTKPAKNIDLSDDDDLFSSGPKIPNSVSESVKEVVNDEDLFSPIPETIDNTPSSSLMKTKEETKPQSLEKSYDAKIEDDNLFSSPKKEQHVNKVISKAEKNIANIFTKTSDSDDDIFSSLPKPSITKSSQNDEQRKIETNDKATDEFEDIFNTKESPTKTTETKKIGKLNTKNFNINVNALIPGASPKKQPKEPKDEQTPELENAPNIVKLFPSDEIDSQPKAPSNKVASELNNEKENTVEKSVTFDDKTESGVLDNNLSKQRPRIQVKRRPSSRRARHEAVRKSAIDFGDDTDNSSSFDEPVKHTGNKATQDITHDNKDKSEKDVVKKMHDSTEVTSKINDPKLDNKEIENETAFKTGIFVDKDEKILPSNFERNDKESVSSKVKTETTHLSNVQQKQSTTKIVYILNDEDIFNTGPENVENEKNIENSSESIERTKTLGKTYKPQYEKKETIEKDDMNADTVAKNDEIFDKGAKTKSTLFDDSDEELFNKNKKIVKKAIIFDSDSEDDLFTGKKRTEKQSKEQKNKEVKEKIVVKGSLFGDEDDDDDLFGVKKGKNEPKQQSTLPSTSKGATAATASKSTEPVFDDPLSMLGDD